MSTMSRAVRWKVSPMCWDGSGALAVDGEVDAVVAQDAREQVDVGKVGDVLERQPVGGQQAGDHQRQRRVLGAGDRDACR